MNHKDYVLAAKELNEKAGSNLKTVAIKGDDLKKSIQDLTPTLTEFDFSTLTFPATNVLDSLDCQMPEPKFKVKKPIKKPAKIIPIKKEERTAQQQGPALIAAASDLIDFLGFPKDNLKEFKALGLADMVKELQKFASEINVPYEEKGETVTPDDKPGDFKPGTIEVFEANDITVNWNETKEETEQKADTKPDNSKKEKKAPKKKPELKFHEYADLFPETDEETVNEIVKDMNENGYRADRPIVLFSGKIADGRTRYKAANIAQIDPAFTTFDGTKEELFKHVIALNLKRRHLTPAQRATIAADLLPGFEKIGKEKQSAAGKGKTTGKAYRATEEAAKATGSTSAAVSAAKKIKKTDPKKFEEMKKGTKTIASAKRETETKDNAQLCLDAEKIMKAKLRMAQTAIHDYLDAAELAEVEVNNEGDLTLMDDTIQKIINAS